MEKQGQHHHLTSPECPLSFLGWRDADMEETEYILFHLDPKIGPNNFKNISISTGSKHWARRPSIIHFLICFPDISHFLGKMGPKMTILDPKQVHLDSAIGPNYLKKKMSITVSWNCARRLGIIHFWICLPDMLNFSGQMGPIMPSLDPKLVHLDPQMGPNNFKNISFSTGSEH